MERSLQIQSHEWRESDVFIVNFEQILHIAKVFPLLILKN